MTDRYDRGAWLAARVAGAATCLLAVGLFVASLPARYRQLLAIGAGDPSLADPMQGVDPALIHAVLARLRLPVAFYAASGLAFEAFFALTFCLVGAVIARQGRHRWLALLGALALVLAGTTYPPTLQGLPPAQPALALASRLLGALAFAFGLVMFYVFPTGRFVPRWTGPLALVWVAWEVASALFPAAPFSPLGWPPPVAAFVWLPWWLSGVVAQVSRYRHVSSPAQRQQTKWILWGLSAAVVGANAAYLLRQLLVLSGTPTALEGLVVLGATPVAEGFLLLAPLSIGVAIVHYRLWDIDVLINRTLVYGALSLLLAGVYLGGVVLLQSVLRALTGQTSDLATVGSTLAVAVSFRPLHRRIQALIDRGFYRRKYDAAKVLVDFSATVRDEVGLGRLSNELLRVVDETMQPAHVTLWLRAPTEPNPDSPPQRFSWR